MKIAFIIPSLANLGPNIVIQTLVRHLISDYKDVIEDIVIYYFDEIKSLDFMCKAVRISEKTIIPFDYYDIIHSNGYRPDKYLYRNRKLITKAQTVSTLHQDIFQYFKFAYNLGVSLIFTPLWLFYLKRLNAVVPISKKIETVYYNKLDNLTSYINNGVDLEPSKQPLRHAIVKEIQTLRAKTAVIIATYANITKIKGLEQLIELARARTDIGVVIIGNGKEKRSLQKIAIKSQLEDRVLFLPFLEYPYHYLKYFDLYAMPSRSEGFGLALIEGVLSKIPIVASNIDVFKTLFDYNEISFFNLDDIKSLSDAVNYAISNKTDLIHNAYQKAEVMYTGEAMAKRYIDLYISLLNQ